MTREEREYAIDIIQSILNKYEEDECLVTEITIGDEDIKAFKMAIKALEQEPCEDAISRQEVLDLIADYDLSMGQVVRGIHALPSVTPQEPILDKIREEIKVMTSNRGFLSCSVGYIHKEIDNVFDKYKAESEDKE